MEGVSEKGGANAMKVNEVLAGVSKEYGGDVDESVVAELSAIPLVPGGE